MAKSKKLRVPTRAEVEKANATGCIARERLARKYGLSGAVANIIGLGMSCEAERRKGKDDGSR